MANTDSESQNSWGNVERHVREKTKPQPRDLNYFHFADLNEFILSNRSDERLTMLDYGAGASPYRGYFPNSDYRRADIKGNVDLRYQIDSDSRLPEEDDIFDLILSTQVAEHVPNPDVYFKECYRLLKKGGRLILTTHGIWDEHGSPYDFQRWTESGLRRDLSAAGFKQIDIYKLTCNLRAGFLIFTRALFSAPLPGAPFQRLLFKITRRILSHCFLFAHQVFDKWWPGDKIFRSRGENPGPTWYIGLAAVVQK